MTEVGSTVQPDAIRAAFVKWMHANWDPRQSLREWRTLLVDAGWAVPSWPVRWHGQGLPSWSDEIVREEIARAGLVGPPLGTGMGLAAPTILTHGSDDLRARFLRPILTGEETWCQLFSEPGAGSDLAGLTTHATLDGEQWVVNGQKVWNTSAHHADFGLLLARSDWDAPKHRGLTYFALPMHQPGVVVRPLRQMNNHASFNEVFMSDATVPASFVIGAVGGGWTVALDTLAYERGIGGVARPRYDLAAGRALTEAEHEAEEHFATYKWYPQRFGRVDLVVEHARTTGRIHDPVTRQAIVKLLSLRRINEWTTERARAARDRGTAGPAPSINKLLLSEISRGGASVHALIGGAMGMLSGTDGAYDGAIAEVLVSVQAQSIAGGTDEIQKNILGERVLGLPREPEDDKNKPFREVRHN